MAMVSAKCICKTCGEEFIVRVKKRNTREATEFERWATESICECEKCRAKRFAEENALSAGEAQAANLPALKGSAKQVAWAGTLRMDRYNQWMNELKQSSEAGAPAENIKYAQNLFAYIMSHATNAAEWIENRNGNGAIMLNDYARRMKDEEQK